MHSWLKMVAVDTSVGGGKERLGIGSTELNSGCHERRGVCLLITKMLAPDLSDMSIRSKALLEYHSNHQQSMKTD